MHELDTQDILAQQREAREGWEFSHHGIDWPFDEEFMAEEEIEDIAENAHS